MAAMTKTTTPGIYKRGNRYVVVWRHRGRQHKSFHRTLAEARAAKGGRQSGERTPTTRRRFDDYATAWLDSYSGRTSRGLSEPTRDAYRAAIEHRAVPFFAGYRLADVEPPDVRRFIGSLEAKGLAPASIRKEVAPLRALFATALEDGALRTNPTLGVRVSGRRDDDGREIEAKALTREELARLLGELPEQWRLFFELLAHSGLRISEAIGLTWADVAFGARPRLLVRRQRCRGQWRTLKSRAGRRDVPLSKGMAQRLWTAKRGHADTEPLFATSTGTHLSASNVRRRVLEPAREQAGLPWVGFHSHRHTCASLLFENGKNVKQVSEWLGHSDPGFTLRTYVHLMDEGLGDADFLDTAVKVGAQGADGGRQDAAAVAATA